MTSPHLGGAILITQSWPTALAYSIVLSTIGVPIFKAVHALARTDVPRTRARSAPPRIELSSINDENTELSNEEVINTSTPKVKRRPRTSSVGAYDLREILGE